jgi:hypothetical protein
VLLAVPVLAAAYVTLPWWAPKDYLRRHLAERLAGELHLPVHIGSLSLDWAGGVRLRDVSIGSPEDFSSPSPAPMIRIDRVGAGLSPIRYLLTGQLDRLDVEGLHVTVESDENGRLNVASLRGLSATPLAPRVAVRRASAAFRKCGGQDLLRLALGDMVFQAASDWLQGQVTLSAVLEQQGSSAPIQFRLDRGDGNQTVAMASLGFSNLDMGQLPLRDLLPNLPLRKCSGLAEGWAGLRIDNQGLINQFSVNVSVSHLEVQPLEGPQLPTADKAGLNLTAAVDPLTGRVWLHRFEVHLPGAELVGDAELSTGLLAGRWEALKSLNVTGQLRPADLAALMTGKADLPAGLEVDGPLAVRLGSRYDGTHLDLEVAAQGDAAEVWRSGRIIKPAGRTISLDLKGRLDRRSWHFSAERAELKLGGNHLSGSGAFSDIRRLVGEQAGGRDVLSAVLDELASSDCSGEWEVADWSAIHDVLAGWDVSAPVLAGGPVTGRWFLDRTGPLRLHVRAEVGSEARLNIGDLFVQPEATAVVVDLAGTIDAEGSALRDLDAELAVGTGRLTVDRGLLSRAEGVLPAQPPAVVLQGRFEARAMESLVACLPLLKSWGLGAAGRMGGDFELQVLQGRAHGLLTASMDSATLTAGKIFAKAPGQKADLEIEFTRDGNSPPQEKNRLAVKGALDVGDLSATALWADDAEPTGQAGLEAHVRNAHRLPAISPLLAGWLGEAHLEGRAHLDASVRWKGSTLEGKLRCDAGGIEYVSAQPPTRVKTADTPLAVELVGKVTNRGQEGLVVVLDQARLTAGNNWVQMRSSGTIESARAHLRLTDLRGSIAGKDVVAAGAVTMEDVCALPDSAGGGLKLGHVTTDGLEVRVGENHGWIIADLRDLPARPSGDFHLLAEEIDDKDISEWIGALRQMGRTEAPGEPNLPAQGRQDMPNRLDRLMESVRAALSDITLRGKVSIDRYLTFDATVDRYYLARCLEAQLSIEKGRVLLMAEAAVNGGIVANSYQVNLAETSPQVAVKSAVRELMANEAIQPQLAKNFPGNTVYGLFSRAEDSAVPLRQMLARAMDSSAPVWPRGQGRTVTIDGLLEGRAVPSFVSRIFPGLNLTRYRYHKMTAFTEYRGDGVAVNDMVFSGQTYDIYIEGTTGADNIGRYEIGLILVGSPQSAEWNHTYRQGRIPLLKFKARIEGGRMHNESVTFVYPNESLFTIFLKNNIFYRIWLASRK